MPQGLPYIFILDWDGTIAGKVDFQSKHYILKDGLSYISMTLENSNDQDPLGDNTIASTKLYKWSKKYIPLIIQKQDYLILNGFMTF